MYQRIWQLLIIPLITVILASCASSTIKKSSMGKQQYTQHNFFPTESHTNLPLLYTNFEIDDSYQVPDQYQPLQQVTLINQQNLLWPTVANSNNNVQFESINLSNFLSSSTLLNQVLLSYRYNARASELLQANQKVSPQLLQKRQSSIYMANKVLNEFLANNPNMIPAFESAAGYAVLDITSFNALIYVGGWGYGVLFDNVNQEAFYIDYFRTGTGFGFGYISEYSIILFNNHASIDQIIGADVGLDIGASGTLGFWTKYYSFNPTVDTYRMYRYGANIQANWGGTLFWESPELN